MEFVWLNVIAESPTDNSHWDNHDREDVEVEHFVNHSDYHFRRSSPERWHIEMVEFPVFEQLQVSIILWIGNDFLDIFVEFKLGFHIDVVDIQNTCKGNIVHDQLLEIWLLI